MNDDSASISAHRADSSTLLATLTTPSETLIAARGGAGGRGNAFFASANQRAPGGAPVLRESALRLAERGAEGEVRRLLLRLPQIADVGLLGAPNAGKSTLLR
uniref:GTP1_OBG domain-containing protein n=1 Tax=Mesocestoides corti TaxID=53468 RepID=A0A5K3G2X9_MESCO